MASAVDRDPRYLCYEFLLVVGCIAGVMVAEITCWVWTAWLLTAIFGHRLPGYHKLSQQFHFTLAKWIDSAKRHHVGSRYKGCTSYTKRQDKMIRLASANHELLSCTKRPDETFANYLREHRAADQYMNVTFSGMRNNVNDAARKYSQFT